MADHIDVDLDDVAAFVDHVHGGHLDRWDHQKFRSGILARNTCVGYAVLVTLTDHDASLTALVDSSGWSTLRPSHQHDIIDALIAWLRELTAAVEADHEAIEALQTAEGNLAERVGNLEAGLTETAARLNDLASTLGGRVDDLTTRVAALEAVINQPSPAVSFTVIIPNTERNPNNMSFQIADNDTSKVASVTYTDAVGNPTTDTSATVSFASSDSAVLAVDATSGSISPVGLGTAQVQATVTQSDGTSLSGVPADVEIVPGPATGFTVSVG